MVNKYGLEEKKGISNDEFMMAVLLGMILVALISLLIIFPELWDLLRLFLILIISDIALIIVFVKRGKRINDEYNILIRDGIRVKARINHDNTFLHHSKGGSSVFIECSWFDQETSRIYIFKNAKAYGYGISKVEKRYDAKSGKSQYVDVYKEKLKNQEYAYVLLDPLNYNHYQIIFDNLFDGI